VKKRDTEPHAESAGVGLSGGSPINGSVPDERGAKASAARSDADGGRADGWVPPVSEAWARA
jgi:hypothetical protein